jgi:hypothetical protein
MQKYISLFFSVLLFLTACKSNELPKDVLNEKDMLNLMLDIHLTDGTVYQVPQVPDSLYKYSSAKFVALFKKHHTTDAVYKTSLKYYSKQPEKIQDMYNKLETIIKGKIDSLNKVTAAEAIKAAAKAKPVVPTGHKSDSVARPTIAKPQPKKLLKKN